MIAYKGISPDMTARLGNHDGEVFRIGQKYSVEQSKTARNGYHACENPLNCLTYYDLTRDRFFKVECGGSIDEDDSERIACTEMTILEELTIAEVFAEAVRYIVRHPERDKWECRHNGVEVRRNNASASIIAIARGEDPRATITTETKQVCGYIGLIKEDDSGQIIAARSFKVDGNERKFYAWYHIADNGSVEEVD